MKKFLLIVNFCLCLLAVKAQVPEDVLRYSYFPQHGSARNMAVGGAMGSLGGDISALYVNPAGLGLYKTSEFVFSPGLKLNNNKVDYFGTNSTSNKTGFDIGTSGFVFGFNTPQSKWTNQAFSIGVNQTANFNNVLSYKGSNNTSSYSEVFTEEISRSRLNFDQILNNSTYAFGSAPAIYTYLVDTFKNARTGALELKGLPELLIDKGIALNQQKTVTTTGGVTEIAFGYAANMEDKLYIGGSMGIAIVRYNRHTLYRESDPTSDKNNNFDYFELNDYLTTTGVGVNAKLGLIYKPVEQVRIGIAVHTPTFYNFTDKQSTELVAATENYNGIASTKSSSFTGGPDGTTKYDATTPWKAMISGSYVFREISDTRKQRAFITADVEYVGFPSASFKPADNVTNDQAYYTELKSVIKDYYKGAVNFRLGGELKFNTWMFRAGTAYYSNPYQDNNLKSHHIIASGGIGYRNYGMFIDLTYAHTFNRDVDFAYRLQDKPNYYAEQTGSIGNLMLTLGFKL